MRKITSEPEKVGFSTERLARIRPVIEAHVGDHKLAGALTLISRRGELAHLECVGLMDRENKRPMRPDTIFRIYSMTKPVASVGLMMLYEMGHFQLYDPVSKFIPAFEDLKVYGGGEGTGVKLADLEREVTIRDLLTHTSGLTYHFLEYGPVEEMYRMGRVTIPNSLSEFVEGILELPLAFQPGSSWRYSAAHDVVGYLIEIMSGKPLDEYLGENLFKPLGMVDTGYYVPRDKLDRFAAMYGSCLLFNPDMTLTRWYGEMANGARLLSGPEDSLASAPHNRFRGGTGLVSTAPDYLRFCQMLLNKGQLEGKRILSRKTVELMTVNHLTPELLPYEIGGIYSPGVGYGLGFGVLLDVGQCQILGSAGLFSWGGAAATSFWVDPVEELIGIQMAQFQPSGYFPISPDFRVMAYQAIMD